MLFNQLQVNISENLYLIKNRLFDFQVLLDIKVMHKYNKNIYTYL